MNHVKHLISIILIICTLLLVSCSGRKKVTVIQGNNNPPETKKVVDAEEQRQQEQKAHDYAEDITVTFSDKKFTLKTLNASYDFTYTAIEEYSYMTDWNYAPDTLIEGSQSNIEINAKMRTSENEEYYLSIYKTTPVYISVYYGGDVYVFNLDSTTATKECYQTLKTHIG